MWRMFIPVLAIMLGTPDSVIVDGHVHKAERFLEAPRAKVMILGTFHFADAGLDGYRPKHEVDVRSPERQQELEQLLVDLF